MAEHIVSGTMRDEPMASSNTILAPTVLFWMVCGLGYEPRWLLRASPLMSLFDGIHMVASWLMSYFKLGRSYRVATAETLLNRLTGGTGILEALDMWKARSAINDMAFAAANVANVIPSEGKGAMTIQFRSIEKARDAVNDLISRTVAAEAPFNQFVARIQFHEGNKALAALQALLAEATEIEILLGQLILSGDSPREKEKIRRALLPYKSSVLAAKASLETLVASRDVAKARTMLKDLTAQMGFRWFGFGLGVLPQVIKLFGSLGIPLIQVCGAAYLFSWLTFEALVVVAKVLKLDKSDAAWSVEWGNFLERDDRATQSGNESTGRLPQGTVAMRSIAATSSQQPDGSSKMRTTVGSRKPNEHFLKLRLLSIFLGAMGVLSHIRWSIILMQDTRALGHVPKGAFGKNSSSLAVILVWVNDLSPSMSYPTGIDTAFVFPFLIMPILAIIKLLLSVVFVLATGQTEKLAAAKYLLIFVGVSLTSRLFIWLFCVNAGIRLKMLTVLRVLFCCVPPAFYFLVRYDEQSTALLSWAEWLG
ncbi:hypothetical protein E0Z10_g1112 [Xylaria hypoxylon]|uniref:Uncharacterized protein n=1 Tax=Xylaria hypoxylon TaxID=37992 RepID=A0A4Z0YUP4_9PEZI|nr:hypothetical protein E0Z10_g1112 [Xylaria hypoxylon]